MCVCIVCMYYNIYYNIYIYSVSLSYPVSLCLSPTLMRRWRAVGVTHGSRWPWRSRWLGEYNNIYYILYVYICWVCWLVLVCGVVGVLMRDDTPPPFSVSHINPNPILGERLKQTNS